jgi:hypothetical protein
MADEKPLQELPGEENKKDTVRINLPPGLTGRPTAPTGAPPPRPAAPKAPTPSDDESKKETAVMGTPVAIPKPKKDTSRVQVSAAKPAPPPETPRPTVKIKRDEAPAAVPPTVAATQPATRPVAAAASSADAGLSVAAMVLSLGVLGYLAYVALMMS